MKLVSADTDALDVVGSESELDFEMENVVLCEAAESVRSPVNDALCDAVWRAAVVDAV